MAGRASAYVFAWALPVMLLAWDAVQIARAGAADEEGAASDAWPTVPGAITASSVGTIATGGSTGGHDFVPDIDYAYAISGHSYVGHRVRFVAFARKSAEEAGAVVALYPVNAAVTVHYDPADPASAVLEAGAPAASWQRKAIGVASVAIALGVVLSLLVAFTQRRWRVRPVAPLS